MAIIDNDAMTALFPDTPPKNITAAKMRDFSDTLVDKTGGPQVVTITQFGALADSDGSVGSGTDNYDAIQDAISAAGAGGTVLVPYYGRNNFFRTRGGHALGNRRFEGMGTMGIIYWDPVDNTEEYCFRVTSGVSTDSKAWPYRGMMRQIHIVGNATRRNLDFINGSGASLPGDIITGATSGYTGILMEYADSAQTVILMKMNRNDSGTTTFTPGETVTSAKGTWTAEYVGFNGGTPTQGPGSNYSGYISPQGAGVECGSGDFIFLDQVQVGYCMVGFQIESSDYDYGWMEDFRMFNCKAEQIYEAGFRVWTPPSAGRIGCFMNEFLFIGNEVRTCWGWGIHYKQRSSSGGDGKISHHIWIQLEIDCRGISSSPGSSAGGWYDEFVLLEVNLRAGSSSTYGEIESIFFLSPTIEASGSFNPRAFVFRFKNDQVGNTSNIGPIEVKHGIYYNADGNANTDQYTFGTGTDFLPGTKFSNNSPIMSQESYDACKRCDMEFHANGGGDRDHIRKGYDTVAIDSGTSRPVPATTGLLFLNTSSGVLEAYDGTQWIGVTLTV